MNGIGMFAECHMTKIPGTAQRWQAQAFHGIQKMMLPGFEPLDRGLLSTPE